MASNNHPNRGWRQRIRAAADSAAVEIADKRTETKRDYLVGVLIAREAYMLGFEAGREDAGRGKARVNSRDAVRPVASMRPRPTQE